MSRIDPTLVAVIGAVVLCIFVIRFLFRPKGRPRSVSNALGAALLRATLIERSKLGGERQIGFTATHVIANGWKPSRAKPAWQTSLLR
jgi:hypothetical protein